ncbi:MAG: VWA domain-containing protein [Actinobacteria bacterium]|nr:VWA domain-containing protein [Actinomycetota bacterium]
MRWESPQWLWLLLAVPLLWVVAVRHWRRERDAAHAYADPRLLAVLPSRTARALRLAAVLVALTAAGVAPIALARPVADTSSVERRGTLVIAVDASRSMTKTDVTPSRLRAAASAVGRLLDAAPTETAIGLVRFADDAMVVVAPTTDRAAVRRGLTTLTVREGTAIGNAITTSLGSLEASGALRARSATAQDSAGRVLLLTDGDNSTGPDPLIAVGRARELRVPVYTVLLGNDPARAGRVQTPAESLAAISTQTGGVFTQSASGEDLARVFTDLGRSFTFAQRTEDLVVWAVLAAAILVVIAAGLGALSWALRERSATAAGRGRPRTS